MSEMTSAAQIGKVQELNLKTLFNLEPEKAPLSSSISTGARVNQELVEWLAEGLPTIASTPFVDGAAITAYNRQDRVKIQGYVHSGRDSYKVTTLANANNIAGGINRSELGHQRMLSLQRLKMIFEQQALSFDDLQADSGAVGYRMRGIGSWLNSSAQGTLPVNSALRPAAANHYTGAFASYDEDDVATQLHSMYDERKNPLDLDLFAGIDLKNAIDKFTITFPTASTSAQPRVQYIEQGTTKYNRNVEILDITGAKVRVHLTNRVDFTTSTGAAQTYSTKTGFFLDLSVWQWRELIPLMHEELPKDGSGYPGVHTRVAILTCGNPLGQGYVQPTT